MGQVRDESLIFSLHTLQELERERVEREQAERLARQQAERLSLQEEERLHREAEARRARAEIARKHEEALRRKEEDARFAAMREALVERARVEADWKGRLERESQERAHAERMAALQAQTVRRRARVGVGLSILAGGCAIAWIFFLQARLDETKRLFVEQSETLALERESRQRLDRLLELSERRVAAMTARIENATGERVGSEGSKAPSPDAAGASGGEASTSAGGARGAWKDVRVPGKTPSTNGAPSAPEPKRRPERCIGDGDPLNGCLPKGSRRR